MVKNRKKRRKETNTPRTILYILFLFFIAILLFLIILASQNEVKNNNQRSNEVVKQELESDATDQETTNPREIIIGNSEAGKPIKGYVFGKGKDTTLMFGAIHGNEVGTVVLMNELVDYLRNDSSVISKDKQLVIIPILNPDGYYDRTDKHNANGVNLNLNFSTTDWIMYGKEGQYAGAEPWSESESRALKSVVEEYLPDRMISYHASGYLSNPESTDESKELARWYAAKTGYNYFDDPVWDYSGTATKWFEQTYDKPAITVELHDHDHSDWVINKGPMLELLR